MPASAPGVITGRASVRSGSGPGSTGVGTWKPTALIAEVFLAGAASAGATIRAGFTCTAGAASATAGGASSGSKGTWAKRVSPFASKRTAPAKLRGSDFTSVKRTRSTTESAFW